MNKYFSSHCQDFCPLSKEKAKSWNSQDKMSPESHIKPTSRWDGLMVGIVEINCKFSLKLHRSGEAEEEKEANFVAQSDFALILSHHVDGYDSMVFLVNFAVSGR